ncbi:MAG: outer membrane beta-barrel protein [Vicinamibacterales bacterium]
MSPRLIIARAAMMLALVAAGALPVSAQAPHRGFLTGFGGADATKHASPFFGGAIGVDLGDHVQITADVGRIQNAEPTFTHDDLALVASDAASEGIVASATSKVPTNYYTAGVRVRTGDRWRFRPYALVHAGVAHMSPKPTFMIEGVDVTSLMMSDLANDPGDPYSVRQSFREETRPMATVGGGVTTAVTDHVQVDLGYKFSSIFIKKGYLQDFEGSPHSHNRIDTHRFYAGLGLTF